MEIGVLLQPVLAVTATGLSTGLLWWSLRKDPRSLRNGVLVVVAAYCLLGSVSLFISAVPVLQVAADVIRVVLLGLIVLGLLLLPLLLTANGILMVRRESRSLGNLLSLLVGLGLLVYPLVVIELIQHENSVTGTVAVGLVTAQASVGLLFLVFVAHTALYAFIAQRAPARAVIVLGAGLLAGRVPPLLAGRLRQAVTAAAERSRSTARTLIVPSGGRGADEPRPEGEAMAEWLREHGVQSDDLLVEDRARTTEENLRYSAELLQQRGVPEPYLIVTNNYHAPRAAMLARRLGIDAQAIGSPTALYFWPSAYMREFVAVMVRHKWLVLLAALPVALMMLFTWLSLTA